MKSEYKPCCLTKLFHKDNDDDDDEHDHDDETTLVSSECT
jgi:hypothetical protein